MDFAKRWKSGPLAGWLVFAALLAAGGFTLYWALRSDGVLWLAAANTWLADHFIARFGYLGVFVLMFIESSFLPLPSEIVMPPAGDLARRSEDWTLLGVIVAGTAGSLGGALFNYALARYLGRSLLIRLIERYGGWLRLSVEVYYRSEAFFFRHSAIATFAGRLIPGVRHIISLPAGLARMNLLVFCSLTTLGAGIWVIFLSILGYRFGQDAQLLSEHLRVYSGWLALGGVTLIGAYVAAMRWSRPKLPPERARADG